MPTRIALVGLALLVMSARAAPPTEAYGRLPSIENAALSPDGTKVAYVRTTQEQRSVAIVSIDDATLLQVIRIGDQKLRSLGWAGDEHVLLTVASTSMPFELQGERTEWHLMQAFDLKRKRITGLLDHVHDSAKTMNVVYGRPIVRRSGQETLVYLHGLYVSNRTTAGLFSVNLTTGAERLIKQGSDSTHEWLVNDAGEIVAEQDYVESKRQWLIQLFRDGRARQSVSGIAPIDQPDLLGLSSDGEAIIVARTETEGVTWQPLMIKDGTWGADLAPHEALTDLILEPGSQRMIATAFVGDSTRYHFVDPGLQEGWDWLVRLFRGDRVEFVSISADHARILVEVMGPQSGYSYYLVDLKEHTSQPFGKIYEGVAQIAEVRRINYAAADGLEIPAYLTLPPGRLAKTLPVVVFPHGGPEARDRLSFDWWAQAMAAQGYAVLQPNFRGSSLGRKWLESGFGEWGRKMQTDLSDGLRYLASQGIADPKRACIVGASYGGYAALAGVALESGVYRCAVAVAPVSDPANMLRQVARREEYGAQSGLRYLGRFLGVDGSKDPKLDAISPLKHVNQIAVPVLLIHGRDDTIVPYDQSVDMAKALKRAGKPVEFVSLDKEDHYLSQGVTRLQMLTSSVQFLQKYNPAD